MNPRKSPPLPPPTRVGGSIPSRATSCKTGGHSDNCDKPTRRRRIQPLSDSKAFIAFMDNLTGTNGRPKGPAQGYGWFLGSQWIIYFAGAPACAVCRLPFGSSDDWIKPIHTAATRRYFCALKYAQDAKTAEGGDWA